MNHVFIGRMKKGFFAHLKKMLRKKMIHEKMSYRVRAYVRMSVYVCYRERERERECVCVFVCVCLCM